MNLQEGPAIRMLGVSKGDGTTPILDDAHLSIPQGSYFALTGASPGKTLTLRLLAGLVKPDTGRIGILGRDLQQHRAEVMRHVGVAIDSPALFASLQVSEFLRLGCTLKDLDASDAAAVLSQVGLASFSDSLIQGLSAGQRYRLAIANALLGSPQLLIVDEPQEHVDKVSRQDMRALIGSVHRRTGCTVVMACRSLDDLQDWVTHTAVLDKAGFSFQGECPDLETAQHGSVFLNVSNAVKARAALTRYAYEVELISNQQVRVSNIAFHDAPQLHARLLAERVELFQSIYERP